MNGLRRLRLLPFLLLFMLLAALLAGLALSPPALAFPDVDPADPYAVAIADLATRGIVSGRLDGTSGPTEPVSRCPRWDLSPWGYFDQVHAEPAAVAYANLLLEGLPVAGLDPWAPMPRGEVAQVLHNVLVEIEWDALTAVRALGPEDIRMVEVRSQMGRGEEAPVRLLVPGLDAEMIAELLAGVAAISPATDDPFDDGPYGPLLNFTLRTRDDRSLAVSAVDNGAVAINVDLAGRGRRIVGLAPAVTEHARRLVEQLAAAAAHGPTMR